MSESNTEINIAPIDDVGPIGNVPKLVGICTAHGFWFEAGSQQETCPASCCLAPVHFYAWRNEYKPEPGQDGEW